MNTKNEIIAVIENLEAEYFTKVTNFVKENMPDEWTVTYFSHNSLKIGFVEGQYKDGSDRYCELRVNFGNEWCYVNGFDNSERKFRFEINPFTAGAFNPLESSHLHTYFSGVGFICNNSEFTQALHDLLLEFTVKYEEYYNKFKEITNAEEKIKREKEEKEREEKELADFNEKSEQLKNLSATDDLYVVIKKGNGGKFIYRKQEVELLSSPITWQEANSMKYDKERCYIPYGIKYQVVEAKKIKF